MIIRSRAPLRIGLAGGGTDLAAFSNRYGGAVLNATISMFAYASIVPRTDGMVCIESVDQKQVFEGASAECFPIDGQVTLAKGVYNRLIKDFGKEPLSFTLSTFVDAPAGSGLGSSSTLVVALIGAFAEWLRIPLGEYDIARLAFEIERIDLGMAGGKQDQYAATFGGVNFMEFGEKDRVIVNPLRIKRSYINELERNLLLYFLGTSRSSSSIIDSQSEGVHRNESNPVEAMKSLKENAIAMKEALLTGEMNRIGKILGEGWEFKKRTSKYITTPIIDEIYETAQKAGATGGKISGAGGGGFMTLFCPGETRHKVISSLSFAQGEFRRFQIVSEGLTTWISR